MTIIETSDLGILRSGGKITFPDLSLQEGGKVLLLGPSGSGKTTLLSILAGLLRPTSGTVQWQGANAYSLSPSKRDSYRGENFGFVFQTLHLIPSISVIDNLCLAANGTRPVDKDMRGRAGTLLEKLGLGSKADMKPQTLSQGEQQRVAIARAVMNNPCLIMADEPTSALDDKNARAVLDLLTEHALATGAALLIATHDRRIAESFEHQITLSAHERVLS